MSLKIIKGDLFLQPVECIINPWNRNFIPWWLLLPHGISGQLKKKTGYKIFNQLSRYGLLKDGEAVITVGGKTSFKYIIHVAGLTWYWTSNLSIVKKSIENSISLAKKHNIKSLGFPLIGTGVGGLKEEDVIKIFENFDFPNDMEIILVIYQK